MAHRVIWEEQVGPIPAGMELDHLCRVRACVNVTHLEPVTRAENVLRSDHRCRRLTTCPSGHPYDVVWQGKRYCKTCRSDQAKARRAANPSPTCKGGHPFDGVNARGYRTCSICMTAAGKAAMASRWGN